MIEPRHLITRIEENDADFIFRLVNTEGWLKFIGDRNIKTIDDAKAYINRIRSNMDIKYWVVRSIRDMTPMGILTFIKRDYLEHPDIGFAFLPDYGGQGHAYVATKNLLDEMQKTHPIILATTISENTKSIRLLKKLGFTFDRQITRDGQNMHIYQVGLSV